MAPRFGEPYPKAGVTTRWPQREIDTAEGQDVHRKVESEGHEENPAHYFGDDAPTEPVERSSVSVAEMQAEREQDDIVNYVD